MVLYPFYYFEVVPKAFPLRGNGKGALNGRMYDPVLGRFLSPDNYVQAADFSQSFNRYSYCVNNPLRYTDPSGDFFIFPYIGFSPNGGLNFSLTFGVGVPGVFGGQLTVGGGAGGFNVSAGGFLGYGNAYVGYGSSSGFMAGIGLGFGGLPNGFNTNMTSVGLNYSSKGGLSFNEFGIQFGTRGNVSFDPSIGYSQMIYYSKSSIAELSSSKLGVVSKDKAEIGTNAQKDAFLIKNHVDLESLGTKSVEMENTEFPDYMTRRGYTRGTDGIIRQGDVERVGVAYLAGGFFPKSTVYMSPHDTERNFAISLNHEFIHTWQWQSFGSKMDKSDWNAFKEPSALTYTNMYHNYFDKQIIYNGSLDLYNWPSNLIRVH